MGRAREGGRSCPRAMSGERGEGGKRIGLLVLEFRKWVCLSLNLQATAKPLFFVNYLQVPCHSDSRQTRMCLLTQIFQPLGWVMDLHCPVRPQSGNLSQPELD